MRATKAEVMQAVLLKRKGELVMMKEMNTN